MEPAQREAELGDEVRPRSDGMASTPEFRRASAVASQCPPWHRALPLMQNLLRAPVSAILSHLLHDLFPFNGSFTSKYKHAIIFPILKEKIKSFS